MKLVALVALLAMVCLAGIASADDDSITVSGTVESTITAFSVDDVAFTSLIVDEDNQATGEISCTTNAEWSVIVTGLPMAAVGHSLAPLKIQTADGTPTSLVTVQTSGTTPLVFALGNPATPDFTLHQAVTVADPAQDYSTSLLFTAENTI